MQWSTVDAHLAIMTILYIWEFSNLFTITYRKFYVLSPGQPMSCVVVGLAVLLFWAWHSRHRFRTIRPTPVITTCVMSAQLPITFCKLYCVYLYKYSLISLMHVHVQVRVCITKKHYHKYGLCDLESNHVFLRLTYFLRSCFYVNK